METLLLLLILTGDPGADPLAVALGEELSRLGGAKVQVVVGAPAVQRLEALGVSPRDLLTSPNIGEHLTAKDEVAVIHLERRESVGDVVVDSRIWVAGRADKAVAIAGNGAEPLAGMTSGILKIIGPRLAVKPPEGGADDAQLAALVENRRWLDVLGRLAAVPEKSPRQFYYQVLAYSRLDRRDPAVESLNAMRFAHPGHFLIAAAEELIPRADAGTPKGKADDDGGNTLRDGPAPGEDSSNTLRDAPAAKPADAAAQPTGEATASAEGGAAPPAAPAAPAPEAVGAPGGK